MDIQRNLLPLNLREKKRKKKSIDKAIDEDIVSGLLTKEESIRCLLKDRSIITVKKFYKKFFISTPDIDRQ